jgi:hypothetical protein
MNCEPCFSLAKDEQEWLEKVGTLEGTYANETPVALQAIEDARD